MGPLGPLSINHFHHIDHSIRPRPWSGIGDPEEHYSSQELLDPQQVSKKLVYATHFSATGWGIRSLTNSELGDCFGLSGIEGSCDFVCFPPLPVLQAHLHNLTSKGLGTIEGIKKT